MLGLPRFPRPKLIAASIAAALSGLPLSAFSAPVFYPPNITLDATYSLNGGATVDGMTDSSASIFTAPGGADLFLSKSDGPSDVFFHTYGFSGSPTYFGARASGGGLFDAYTRANYNGSFTNNSAVASQFLFSFFVQQGEVGVNGSGVGMSELLLRLRLDSGSGYTTVAQDSTKITQTTTGTTCVDADFGLTPAYMVCSSGTSSGESANGGLFTINLGTINPNQTFTIDYDIIATVSGDGVDANGNCGYGYGEGVDIAATSFNGGSGCATITSIARSGDPFGGQPDPNPGLFQATFGVPEPGSLALVTLALGGLAAARRRRREKQA